MNNFRRKYIILGSIAIIAVVAVSIVIHYLTSTVALKISFVNTKNVAIVEDKSDTAGPETIATVTKSPSTVRVPRNSKLYAHYTGVEGYADGALDIDIAKKEIVIDPDYSKEKYQTIMNAALPNVTAILQNKYATLDSLYTVSSVEMKQKATWYVVRLDFKGDYSDNSDTLRALFKKDGNDWKLSAGPDILFTTVNYPNIDASILKWANETFTE